MRATVSNTSRTVCVEERDVRIIYSLWNELPGRKAEVTAEYVVVDPETNWAYSLDGKAFQVFSEQDYFDVIEGTQKIEWSDACLGAAIPVEVLDMASVIDAERQRFYRCA